MLTTQKNYCYWNRYYLPTATSDCLKHANLSMCVCVCTHACAYMRVHTDHSKSEVPMTPYKWTSTVGSNRQEKRLKEGTYHRHKPHMCTPQYTVTQT